MPREALRVAVLASGNGSNFQALIDRFHRGTPSSATGNPTKVVLPLLISDREKAPARERAKQAGIEEVWMRPKAYPTRQAYDAAVVALLRERRIDLVVLAGFMRIVGPELVGAYKRQMINVHPSLLPSFPGLNAIEQAWRYGVRVTGCTVHFVDEGMDTGPIIMQAAVPIDSDATFESLEARIHAAEHRILGDTVALLAAQHCGDLSHIQAGGRTT